MVSLRRRADQLLTVRVCPESHDRFGELAEEIQRQVDELAAKQMSDPMSIVTITDTLTREMTAKQVLKLFSELPAEKQLELLVQHFGDDVLKKALEQEHKKATARADPDAYAEQLAITSRRTGKLNVCLALLDMRLTVQLFPLDVILKTSPAKLATMTAARTLQLILEDTEGCYWRVLADTYDTSLYDSDVHVGEQSMVFMGSENEEGGLTSYLYHGTTFYVAKRKERHRSLTQPYKDKKEVATLHIGECLLNGVPMFYDPVKHKDLPAQEPVEE